MKDISQSDIKKYQTLFKEKQGIEFSVSEIIKIIQNIDSIGNLLFDKYIKNDQEKCDNLL